MAAERAAVDGTGDESREHSILGGTRVRQPVSPWREHTQVLGEGGPLTQEGPGINEKLAGSRSPAPVQTGTTSGTGCQAISPDLYTGGDGIGLPWGVTGRQG